MKSKIDTTRTVGANFPCLLAVPTPTDAAKNLHQQHGSDFKVF